MTVSPIRPRVSNYVPGSLSELIDQITGMIGDAPTFVDQSGFFSGQNIDSEFEALAAGLEAVRAKLGEKRFAVANEVAARAKTLFADDPDETNGKTMQGIALLYEIEDLIRDVRSKRVAAKEKDDDGEVTGD